MQPLNSNHGNFWIQIGGLLAALAVILGAFAAHGLNDRLLQLYEGKTHEILGATVPSAQKYLADFKTGAEYQMFHSIALILIGLCAPRACPRCIRIAGISFLVGILLFSGSLYLLVLTGTKWLGAITPIGGVAFIVGWLSLAGGTWSKNRPQGCA